MANRPPYPGVPRWVKISGIIVIVLVLLVVISIVIGHRPRKHTPSSDAGDGKVPHTMLVEEHRVQQS